MRYLDTHPAVLQYHSPSTTWNTTTYVVGHARLYLAHETQADLQMERWIMELGVVCCMYTCLRLFLFPRVGVPLSTVLSTFLPKVAQCGMCVTAS